VLLDSTDAYDDVDADVAPKISDVTNAVLVVVDDTVEFAAFNTVIIDVNDVSIDGMDAEDTAVVDNISVIVVVMVADPVTEAVGDSVDIAAVDNTVTEAVGNSVNVDVSVCAGVDIAVSWLTHVQFEGHATAISNWLFANEHTLLSTNFCAKFKKDPLNWL